MRCLALTVTVSCADEVDPTNVEGTGTDSGEDLYEGLDGVVIFTDPIDPARGGMAIAPFADVDGDGRAELAVVPRDDVASLHVVRGRSGPGAIRVGDPGTDVWTQRFPKGWVQNVQAAEIDGDGDGDLIVSAETSETHVLLTYVLFGRLDPSVEEVEAQVEAGDVLAITGEQIAWHAVAAGDVDGDGLGDILQFGYLTGLGDERVMVLWGRSEGGRIEVPDGDPGEYGIAIAEDNFLDPFDGTVIAGDADVNGDGLADFAIGTGAESFPNQLYVVFGGAGLRNGGADEVGVDIPGLRIRGGARGTGGSVDLTPDLNGDGRAEIAIGGRYDTDRCYVVFGREETGTLDLSAMTSEEGIEILGTDDEDPCSVIVWTASAGGGFLVRSSTALYFVPWTGASVDLRDTIAERPDLVLSGFGTGDGRTDAFTGAAGDFDGDGTEDILIGSYLQEIGRAYVVFGSSWPGSGP